MMTFQLWIHHLSEAFYELVSPTHMVALVISRVSVTVAEQCGQNLFLSELFSLIFLPLSLI